MKRILVMVLALALTLGCVQETSRQPTSTLFVSTSVKPTTSVKPVTTILTESTMSTVLQTTSVSTTTTILSKCGQACVRAGYVDGVCRLNSMQCRLKGEIYYPPGERACWGLRAADTCCCKKTKEE